MKKRFTILIAAAVMLLAILLQPVRLWGQSTTYTSNVTLTTTGGSNASECSVSINSSSYSAIKIGTSKASGYAYITVPAGTVTLHVHCAAWNGDAASLSVSTTASGVTITPTSWSLTADSGISGSGSSFTINASNASTSYYKSFTLTGVTSATQIKLQSANKKRAVFWGVNAVVAHTLNYSATNGSISGVDAGSNAVASGASIAEGATVTLTATPDTGYSFTGWSVSGTGSTLSSTSENPTTFTMGTANATVTANFLVASGYITVSPTTATPTCAAEDVVFSIDTDQTLDDNPVVFYTTSTGDETTEKPAWIGDILYDEGELLVEVNANTGAARTAYFRVEEGSVKSDVITINQAVYAPAAPIIPATISFDYTMNVTMSQEAGKTIYYTTDGSTPDNTSTEYIGAFDINATTTVKAIAYDGTYPSAVVSATYTRTYKYINEITAAGTYTVKGTVVAVYGTTGFVLGDGTGYIYDYKSSHGLSVGDKVSITSGTIKDYNHVWEFNSASTSAVATSSYTTGTPAITTLTSSIISSYSSTTNLSTYFEVVGPYSNTNKEITVYGSSIPVRLSTTTDYSSLNGKTVKAKGYFLGFNKDTDYFYLCPESVEAVPVVTTSVSSISDFNYNVGGGPDVKSFTVSGANLTGNITVSTNSANFEISSDNSNWQTSDITISKGSGTVDATTIYVRLKSGLSSATYNGKITVSSENADDKEIALTGTVTCVIAYDSSLPTGCSVSSEPTDAQVYNESVSVSATAGSGYKFSAWDVYKTGESSTKVTVTNNTFTMPDYNVTVSATFVDAYSVTYNANGGTGEMSDPDSPYASGSTVKVLSNDFTREGYEFSSWNTKSDGSGDHYDPDENDEFNIIANTTLYAQWTRASYDVTLSSVDDVTLSGTYGAEGTIAETDTKSIPYGTEITLSATGLASGKTFVWSVTKNEDSSDVTDDVLDGDILTVPAYAITIGGSVEDVKAIYTVVKPLTTITVSSSGICPDGSTANYETTYSTLGQLTADNSMTLTLSGYQNQIVKKVVLNMKSNAKSGAGSLSVVAGTTTLKSFEACAFSDDNWNSSYTTTYTDVEITMSNSTYKIEDDENLVITIAATENSLYCQRFTIYYETSTTPVINAENVNLAYSATSGEIPYTITNPNGESLTAAKTSGDWISGVTVDGANSKVTFTTTANTGEGREGTITLSYTGASDKVIKVYQEAQKFTVTYAAGTGGSGTMTDSNSPYEYGAEVTLLDNTFTAPSGKMFNDWVVTDGLSNPVSVSDGKFTMPNSNVTVTAQWRDKLKYAPVTNINQLIPGKHYIFVGKDGDDYYAMGKDRGNNRLGIGVSVDGEGKIAETTGLYEFVISGSSADYWTIYDSNTLGLNEGTDKTGYLYAAGGTSSNYLKTQTTNDNKGQWSITIASETNLVTIAANISTTGARKYMRYNHNSGNPDLFSCYESSTANVYLYVRDGDNDCEINSATTISSGITTISGDMNIVSGIVTIKDGATLKINGTLTNTTAANLVIEDGGQLITKSSGVKATVKKNVTAADNWGEQDPEDPYTPTGWYFIASPVNGAAFPTGTVANQDIFQLDWANNKWLNLQYSGNNALLSAGFQRGTGYLYASKDGNTLSVAGEIKPLTEADTAKVILKTTGWNLIGNPLTCKVTVDCAFSELVNASAVTNKEANSVINPCQGIAVYGDAETEVTFTKAATQDAVAPNNNSLQMTLAKTITSRGDVSTKVVDNAVVSFKESKCMPKFNMIGSNTKLFIPQDDEEYSIVFSDRQGDVPLYFKANETGTYTISFAGDEMSLNGIYLIDILAEEEIDLSVNPSYTFIGSPADRMARFKIVFRNANGDGTSDIFAYQNGNDIIVSGEGELQIFDVMGRMVSRQRVNGVETVNVKSQGVYIFRLNDKTQKIVVR
ncbi:MAG: InlB B-repeat-containing protein [Bacteroidales bacterium]|nr:InlB B-repeat-containing protein [Bacteroidales bacterium]